MPASLANNAPHTGISFAAAKALYLMNEKTMSQQETLSDTKRALLERLRQGRGLSDIIPRLSEQAARRASFGQERLWFMQQLAPNSVAYSMHQALRIDGVLNMELLAQAFQQLIASHDVLQHGFRNENGQLFMHAVMPAQLELLDLSTLAAEHQELALTEHAQAHAASSFNLEHGPLLRLTAVRLSSQRHALLFAIHHIISDEWSNTLFWKELGTVYTALSQARPIPNTATLQYADYAAWQRQQLSELHSNRQLDYWRAMLAGPLPSLNLPIDHQRPAVQSYHGAIARHMLSPQRTQAILDLAQSCASTAFVVILAAYAALLSRYTGQQDILIGTPVANRSRPEISNVLGLFINTIVLRANLEADTSFLSLLQQMRERVLGALEHQDLPFERLVEELQPRRDPSQHVLFQTMLVWNSDPDPRFVADGIQSTVLEIDGSVAKFDLTLFALEEAGVLKLSAEYNTDLFEHGTIERLLKHFDILLSHALAQPERPIALLPLLDDTERALVLHSWNNHEANNVKPGEHAIQQLFEDWVEQSPYAQAVLWGSTALTYAKLEAYANQLAHALRHQGVGPNVPVLLCLERSPELIIAILAVLKAGGMYVPLDPGYPAERIAFVIDDVGAALILSQPDLSEQLPLSNAHIMLLDADMSAFSSYSQERPQLLNKPDDYAYIIYTSGSTGRPKGVPVTHAQLLYSTYARLGYYAAEQQHFLLLSSAAFDSSIAGIFGTLCAGGSLCLPAQREERDVGRVAALIQHYAISDTLCLPSLYQLILEYSTDTQLSSLRRVIVAGESCPAALVQLHMQRLPEVALYNEYGPTEGTVWASVHRIQADDPIPVPIGKPIVHATIYLLDARQQPVPIGILGELYVGGAGVVDGYYNRPDLTAERFVELELQAGMRQRLYRTGDLARWLPNGTLQFFGRIDQQIKIRGFRIEPGEIEQILQDQAGIQQALVLAWQLDKPVLSDEELLQALQTMNIHEALALLDAVSALG